MATARRTRSTTPPLTLGFAGSGELSKDATWAQLDDLVDDSKVDIVYLPVSDEDTTDEIVHVHRWCLEHEIPYSTVSNEAALKIKALKKIIDGAVDDYGITEQGAGRDILDLLAGDEKDPVEDGRLIMFFNGDEEEDVAIFEYTEEVDVKAFDICDEMSQIKHDDAGDDGTAPEPPEEPTKDEVAERRGRRAAKDTSEEDKPAPAAKEAGDYTTAEKRARTTLLKSNLVELKKKAKGLGDDSIDTEYMRGMDKEQVADLIIVTKRNLAAAAEGGDGDGEGQDEAQASVPSRSRRRSSEEPSEPAEGDDGAEDPKEAVFARLRASRERAEAITQNLVRSLGAIAEEGEGDEVLERAAAAVAASLMLFAEYIVTEVRKPKSAGRPRADGSEAQPKPPVDPDAPKRGRGRPRKSEDD